MQKESKTSHYKSKAHECNAGTNPCKQRALCGKIVAEAGLRLIVLWSWHVWDLKNRHKSETTELYGAKERCNAENRLDRVRFGRTAQAVILVDFERDFYQFLSPDPDLPFDDA